MIRTLFQAGADVFRLNFSHGTHEDHRRRFEAIVTYTMSGGNSLRASRERPAAPILSMATSAGTARRMALAWGIHSVEVSAIATLNEMSAFAAETARREGFAATGDTIPVAAGIPVGVSGTTNVLKILTV